MTDLHVFFCAQMPRQALITYRFSDNTCATTFLRGAAAAARLLLAA
ncbi:hypothetical protein D052_4097 [Vibrio parahaemolyticus 10290]|nr:hypothetical protein D052_4097 [Vibrio parahaemolyticus 10290]